MARTIGSKIAARLGKVVKKNNIDDNGELARTVTKYTSTNNIPSTGKSGTVRTVFLIFETSVSIAVAPCWGPGGAEAPPNPVIRLHQSTSLKIQPKVL